MRFLLCSLLLVASVNPARAQQAAEPANPPATSPQESSQAAAPSGGNEPGFMDPAQLKDLLHKLWLAEFRVNDLLSEAHPDKWKMSDDTRKSFNDTLATLRKTLTAQEDWRSQFEKRTDSMYLGYETFISITAVLPRLDGVGRSVSQFENKSLGAQYSQAGNQLFDLQQALQPYLEYLLRNQDQVLQAAQNNLASCQNQLGYAMRSRTERAKEPVPNTFTRFVGRRKRPRPGEAAASVKPGQPAETKAEKKPESKSEKKPETKPGDAAKPSPPAKSTSPEKK